jgi:DNA-binding transcriptional ArsR family regulator
VTANASGALSALGDPTRRAIFERLGGGPLAVGQLADGLPVSRPAVSQHLRVLKDAGLVTERRDGTKRLYRARPETIAQLWASLEVFWSESLRTLKAAAEREEQQRRLRHGRRHESH